MKLATSSIQNYDIIRELSHQECKKTVLARDNKTQTLVILKLVQFNPNFHWSDLKLFEREAQVLMTLNHPAIPKHKDYFETEIDGIHSFVLVQSYLEADSLEALIKSGRRFSEKEVMSIAQQLLAILSYLHQQTPPVTHRDIKPGNILLADSVSSQTSEQSDGPDNSVYLVDFGAVHTPLTKEQGTITIVGSYGYIPLEVFMGRAIPASDLYSLGMTLIHLITGIHPADILQVDGKIQLHDPVISDISPRLIRWLGRMTHPYLDKRFESAEAALRALVDEDSAGSYAQYTQSADSLVRISQQRDRLEIEIYQRPVSDPVLYKSLNFVIIGLCVASLAIAFGVSFPNTFSVLFFPLLPLAGIGISIMFDIPRIIFSGTWNQILQRFQARYRQVISIDRQTGIRTGTARKGKKAVRWKRKTSAFHAIDLLAYNPGYSFNSYVHCGQRERARHKTVLPTFSIHAGSTKYEIGHGHLSTAEFWQIGEVISQFTGLEVQTIYPTPVVVPQLEATCGC
ncbi:MAG: serine/threonine-protein kinase [Cyanobacteria bacterium J06623_4]